MAVILTSSVADGFQRQRRRSGQRFHDAIYFLSADRVALFGFILLQPPLVSTISSAKTRRADLAVTCPAVLGLIPFDRRGGQRGRARWLKLWADFPEPAEMVKLVAVFYVARI